MDKILTEEEEIIFWSAKTLPEDFAFATDFEASEAIELDKSIKLPSSFSLWKRIYKTSNQWKYWSCTSLWTVHWIQILEVSKKWVVPTENNIVTPDWKDLWTKMWHDLNNVNDSWDYVETAVSTALKQWVLMLEDWKTLVKFDWYATQWWEANDKWIELIKRYLYNWNPIVWCIKWNSTTWNEMTKWEVKTLIPSNTWGHCIALVGWDEWGFWFVNSWSANDEKKLKSRFHISYDIMKKLWWRINYRYWVLYNKADAKIDPEYLKRKNVAKIVLEALKKQYDKENTETKEAIIKLSQALRKAYPEINQELPL